MNIQINNVQEVFEFFKTLHKDQEHSPGMPQWAHIFRVGDTLRTTLNQYEEGTEKEKYDLVIAGIGHDSIEDTTITYQEIKNIFGLKIAELIHGVTNEKDPDVTEYIPQVVNNNEEVRLIKLTDLLDNYTAITYNCQSPQDIIKRVLPMLNPMYESLLKTTFNQYKKTATNLIDQLITSKELCLKVLKNFQ